MHMRIDQLSPGQRAAFLRAAVLEHFRTLLGLDGAARQRIAVHGLDGTLVRRIAREYRVSRGIVAGQEHGLAQLLLDLCPHWPATLEERCGFCINLGEGAAEGRLTHGRQVSAMTKLMWFLNPEGWTRFDRLAADAMGIAQVPSDERARRYYAALSNRGFLDTAQVINGMLEDQGAPGLFGERIFDKYLMLAALARQGDETPLLADLPELPHTLGQIGGARVLEIAEHVLAVVDAQSVLQP
jgi:hypothetical protein